MTQTGTVLDRITRVPGVRGALIVSAEDGLIVAEQLMDGVDGRAAAALTGSLVARLARATAATGLGPPAFVQVRGDGGAVLAAPGAGELVLVVVAGPDANVGLARLEMLDAAGQLV
jgi:predicted regulator of Ras-like GTPase activity (Roadblock/LC7/MglB family)